jgi:two-component system, cell cycle response regulator
MKILVADDDPVTRLALETLLTERGFLVHTAVDGEQAFSILERDDAPRLAIVDWIMPGMNGLELCRKLRESGSRHRTYIVMLTVKQSTEHLVAGLDAGADDYIRKPFDIDELHARLRAAQRLITAQEQLRARAYVDDLTGVSSRYAIRDLLQKALAHAAREKSPVSIALIDVDRFKHVNDTYGHSVGDMALRGVAALMGPCLRTYDVVGRYGGEEFLIVFPGCSAEDALTLSERIRSHVATQPILTPSGSLRLTVSAGVATHTGSSMDLDALISAADQALYRAKNAGRNSVQGASVTTREIPLRSPAVD